MVVGSRIAMAGDGSRTAIAKPTVPRARSVRVWHSPGEERGSIARRRVQLGVFGAETYFSTLSTENVEMGPYPKRVSPALHAR